MILKDVCIILVYTHRRIRMMKNMKLKITEAILLVYLVANLQLVRKGT